MKMILTLVCATLLSSAFATNVQWDCFTTDTDGGYWQADGLLAHYSHGFILPAVCVNSTRNGNSVTITGSTDGAILEFIGFWVQMSEGDVINYSTMMARYDIFAATMEYDENDDSEFMPGFDRRIANEKRPIETPINSSVYVAVIADLTDVSDMQQYKDYYYGWVELVVDEDGNVSLGHSALDLDGGPMIVGGGSAIPEPGSAVLMLVGAGVLALRRKGRQPPRLRGSTTLKACLVRSAFSSEVL